MVDGTWAAGKLEENTLVLVESRKMDVADKMGQEASTQVLAGNTTVVPFGCTQMEEVGKMVVQLDCTLVPEVSTMVVPFDYTRVPEVNRTVVPFDYTRVLERNTGMVAASMTVVNRPTVSEPCSPRVRNWVLALGTLVLHMLDCLDFCTQLTCRMVVEEDDCNLLD